MIDSSLMPELPERKHSMFCTKCGYKNNETEATANAPCENSNCQYFAFVRERDYTSAEMTAYGLQCYQLAMERAAQVCESMPTERSGYKFHRDVILAQCAAAIRALALQEKTDTASPEEGTS